MPEARRQVRLLLFGACTGRVRLLQCGFGGIAGEPGRLGGVGPVPVSRLSALEPAAFDPGNLEVGTFELGGLELGGLELAAFEPASFELAGFELAALEPSGRLLRSFPLANVLSCAAAAECSTSVWFERDFAGVRLRISERGPEGSAGSFQATR